jgi:hypothetical protein
MLSDIQSQVDIILGGQPVFTQGVDMDKEHLRQHPTS